MPSIEEVLEKKYEGLEWRLEGYPTNETEFNSFFSIRKANGVEKPTWTKVQEYLTTIQAEYDALDYSRKRKTAYDLLNQLELMSDDSIGGTTTHKDAIIAIKKKYPKPE